MILKRRAHGAREGSATIEGMAPVSAGGITLLFYCGRLGALRFCESTSTHTAFIRNQRLAAAKIYHALVIKRLDAERRLHYRYEV